CTLRAMRTSTRRPRPVTDDAALASRLGARLKTARLKAGLTQQQLAGDRYTKAYVSALENALIKPSIVALEYLASRLGPAASRLMADEEPAWNRLEADLKLAGGDWQAALDAYADLLDSTTDAEQRAELLRGQAEAFARLDRGSDAVAAAGEAVEIFERTGRELDAAFASYWLANGLYQQENSA